jgi:hypothetical protein
MPGNAGGAKDPDFWHAFDDGEGRVIGGEPRNAFENPEPSEEAIRQGEGGACLSLLRALRQDLSRGYTASDDSVAQVVQKGYAMKGTLVRPARVAVFKHG